MIEMRALKEWGVCSSYEEFINLPQRVRDDAHMVIVADGQAKARERSGRR